MERKEVERFSAGARWFHWVVTIAAITLAVTGLFLYVHAFSGLAEHSYSRIIHRIAAVILVAAPLLFFLSRPGRALHFVKYIFTWGKDDIEWLKAAPDYYFGGDERRMPPQGEMNSGQKLWALIAFISVIGFIVTGAVMWFAKSVVPAELFLWATIIHDVCFIVAGGMLLVHVYLGAIHPRMTESLRSMLKGKVSIEYAKSHHGKWLAEISKSAEAGKETSGAD
jgi:formate dehydrogenase subunit gamma